MVSQLIGMSLGGFLILIVGMIDDRYGMPAKVKLACQLVVGGIMFYFGIKIDYLTVPFYGVVFLETWQSAALTLFWIAGITNALNLLDGLDGLLAGVSLTVASVFCVVSLLKGQFVIVLAMACLAGCSLGFLRYNFNPAQIFMYRQLILRLNVCRLVDRGPFEEYGYLRLLVTHLLNGGAHLRYDLRYRAPPLGPSAHL